MNRTQTTRPRERAINVPGLLLGWVALLLAIQAVRGLLDDADDLRVVLELSFVPAPWSVALGLASPDDVLRAAEAASGDPQASAFRVALARYMTAESVRPWTWLSYAFLHGSWTHVVLNSVWLAAFGTSVVRRAGIGRSLALGVATALGGAVAQWISDPLGVLPVIGASAIVSGFMAAAATFMYASRPGPDWAGAGWSPSRRGGRYAFLRNRNALVFLGIWLAVNLLFGVIAVPLGLSEGAIAWQAHIGGLVAGLALFPLIDPGPPPAYPFPERA